MKKVRPYLNGVLTAQKEGLRSHRQGYKKLFNSSHMMQVSVQYIPLWTEARQMSCYSNCKLDIDINA